LVLIFASLGLSFIIPVTDPNWYFTEQNWYVDKKESFAQTANPGAYFKIGFTGTSTISLWLNQSLSPSQPMQTVRYSIDHQPWVEFSLPNKITSQILLAKGLSTNSDHNLLLFLKNSVQSDDRWLYGPTNRLCVNGLVVENGGKTLPPSLNEKRTMVFWDSIGEGVRDLGASSDDLTDNDSTVTWGIALADALSSEISMVAFGAQGYSVGGNGNTPPIFSPGNDARSSWNKFDAKHSRLNSMGHLHPQPDYIFCGHGTNDVFQNASPQAVIASTLGWLKAQRTAAPNSVIFVVIPFGRFMVVPITSAFRQYQNITGDENVYLLDLPAARVGLDAWGTSVYSDDGIHPLAFRDGQLGAMLAVSATRALMKRKEEF